MMEHHTPQSHQGRLHALQCLKEHLVRIVNDAARLNNEIKQPDFKAPARKHLPSLGQETADARDKDEEKMESKELMLSQRNDVRSQLTNTGQRDEMSTLQQSRALDLKPGHIFQCDFKKLTMIQPIQCLMNSTLEL